MSPLRSFTLAAALAVTTLAVAACGGSTSSDNTNGSSDGGAGNDPSPDAFVFLWMRSGADSGDPCGLLAQGPVFSIGDQTEPQPSRVQDGQSWIGGTVHLSCSVASAASGFDVKLQAALEGGGSILIASPAGAGAVTESGGQGITVDWQDPMLGAGREDDCTLAFTYRGGPIPDSPAVAPGRIWAHVSCPNVAVSKGGAMAGSCDGEADFLFEDCAQ